MKNKSTAPKRTIYATVVMMNGHRTYSSFSADLDKLKEYAERMPGIIAIEEAHAKGGVPVWTREETH